MARGARLDVDGRLGDILRKNVRGNSDSSRREFGELVRLLFVQAWHVVELYVIELVFEGSHGSIFSS
jgi:hypothetical protein